jgi:hypothetical protein
MLRQRLNDDLKTAMKARDQAGVSALRMVLAAIKDKDIAARPQGNADGIDDAGIIDLLQKMVKQRQESIELYKKGNRQELVDQEQGEIDIIERYMPQKLSEAESAAAIDQVVAELGATNIKDMGRVMAALKERFAGRMDFAKAGALIKQKLG